MYPVPPMRGWRLSLRRRTYRPDERLASLLRLSAPMFCIELLKYRYSLLADD